MLEQQYAKRSPAERAARPVDVHADAGTNTLIVSTHAELFEDIKKFVDEVDKAARHGRARHRALPR